jgi:dihydrofolate synthase/folylpolyglutamate synthase
VGGADGALERVWLPGRFQRIGSLVLDVAHNPASAAVLGATLDVVRPPRPIVALVAVLGDKDWRAILDALARHVDRVVLTLAPSAPATRAWRVEDAFGYASARGMAAECVGDFGLALERAQAGAGTTLVTGSFHTVGDAMVRLQLTPLAG